MSFLFDVEFWLLDEPTNDIILTIFKNIFSEKYEELYIFLCGDGSGSDGEQIVSTLILKGMICIVLAILVSGYTLRYFYTFNCC